MDELIQLWQDLVLRDQSDGSELLEYLEIDYELDQVWFSFTSRINSLFIEKPIESQEIAAMLGEPESIEHEEMETSEREELETNEVEE